MALPCYLAMTAAEFATAETLPERIAWMACHFSSYGLGLSNAPQQLPAGSMVILNDRTPIHGHDPALIAQQLTELLETLHPSRLLLDLQRPDVQETAAIAHALVNALPCPVGITQHYARELDCPVFLPPPPLHMPLQTHLAPWKGREIWLELALEAETITVTAEGAQTVPAALLPLDAPTFEDHLLHCRYHTAVTEDRAVFSLLRDKDHLPGLLEEAEKLGVTQAVGLYQQLGSCAFLLKTELPGSSH